MMKLKSILALGLSVCMLLGLSTVFCGAEESAKTLDQIADTDLISDGYEEDQRIEIDFSQPMDDKWVATIANTYKVEDGVLKSTQNSGSLNIRYLPGEELASAKQYVWSFDYRVDDFQEDGGELAIEFVSTDIRFLIYFYAGGSAKVAHSTTSTHNLGIEKGVWHNFTVTRNDHVYTFYMDGVYFADGYNTKESTPFAASKAYGMFFISKPGAVGTDDVAFSVDNIKYITYKKAEVTTSAATEAPTNDEKPTEAATQKETAKQTEKVTEAEIVSETETTGTENKSGSGCGSALGTSSLMFVGALSLGAAVIRKKKTK